MKKRPTKELAVPELAAVPDEGIDYSEIPPLDDSFWDKARLVTPDKTGQLNPREANATPSESNRCAAGVGAPPDGGETISPGRAAGA